ncbi:MAG: hypothetical protein RR998_04240 [Oscillospiraceae bacterium]
MISESFSISSAGGDVFLSLGFAAIASFVYSLLFFLCPRRSKIVAYLLHALFFAFAGLFAFCFIIGTTAAKGPRWYIIAGFAIGVFAYVKCFAKIVGGALSACAKLAKKLCSPVICAVHSTLSVLQKRLRVMYNLLVSQRADRVRKRRNKNAVDEQGTGGGKPPIKAYTQT